MRGFLSFLVLLPLATHAESAFQKARCAEGISQVQEAKMEQTEKARLDIMDGLTRDIAIAKRILDSKKISSDSLMKWKKCLESKLKAFDTHEQSLTSGARTLYSFFAIMGKKSLAMGDYANAYTELKAASETRHSEFDVLQKSFEAWRLWKKQSLNTSHPNLIEIEAYKRDAEAMLKRVLAHPQATVPAKTEAHWALYNDLMTMNNEANAIEHLRAITNIDPKNVRALDLLASFEIKRGRPQVARNYLEQLRKNTTLSEEYYAKLTEIHLIQDSHSEALITAEEGLKNFPKSLALLALKASGLAMNGRLNEAKSLNQKLIKIDPKNPRIRDSQSRVLEKEGDLSRTQGLPGKALSEYKSGLDYSPERISLRIKMASLIFDFRRDQNFEPKDVTTQDMDEVVRLLKPTLDAEPPREDALLLFLQAATRSHLHAEAVELCQNLERSPKSFPTANAVLDCAQIFSKNLRRDLARRILESALFESKFLSSKEKIKAAYQDLKKP